eukprot:1971752-Rhodomonas_salina.4
MRTSRSKHLTQSQRDNHDARRALGAVAKALRWGPRVQCRGDTSRRHVAACAQRNADMTFAFH